LRVELPVVPYLWVTGAVGGEVVTNAFEFQYSVASESHTFASLLTVRPLLEVGLSVLAR
jgi:hypothetical protein